MDFDPVLDSPAPVRTEVSETVLNGMMIDSDLDNGKILLTLQVNAGMDFKGNREFPVA